MYALPFSSAGFSRPDKLPRSVVIIGGGFSGATLAYHLAAITDAQHVQIILIEPRETLGAGLAYSTDEDSFRLNVLSERMSIFYHDKAHFARWAEANNAFANDPQAMTENGIYARRSLFGRYMADQLQPLLDSGRVRHLLTKAINAGKDNDGSYLVNTEDGQLIKADYLVIAASHPLPALPAGLRKLPANTAGLIRNPYQARALERLIAEKGAKAPVLIIGAGLTSADMVAGLSAHGHSGKITVLSRHGLRSRPNIRRRSGGVAAPRLYGDFINPPLQSATQLLHKIRKTIREAANHSIPWQAVIDALRDQGSIIWQALPLCEKQRIVRHLRTYWDAHRFRLAIQTDNILEQRSRENRLCFIAAHVCEAVTDGDGFLISYRKRGQEQHIKEHFGGVIITTGPAHGDIISQCPPLASLHEAGLIAMDPTGLGLHTDITMRAVTCSGKVQQDLFIAGPLARGTFGELMGAPEVARYTQRLAEVIRQALSGTKT